MVRQPLLEPRIEIVVDAYRWMQIRCRCPICLTLDRRYPDDGYQLALFPYRMQTGPLRR